jgi:opacity protein-like surface antigen
MRRIFSDMPVFAVAACVLLALPSRKAMADDLVGVYVGGAVGQARIDATAPYVGGFRENHSAFKLMVGLRSIPLVGAELAYLDFGHPSRINGFISALGILYLPVPIVDIYAKAGLGRLQSTTTTAIVCPATCIEIATPAPVHRTNVGLAVGAGAQFKFGSFAVRGEYERFSAAGGHPGLLSVGAAWVIF